MRDATGDKSDARLDGVVRRLEGLLSISCAVRAPGGRLPPTDDLGGV